MANKAPTGKGNRGQGRKKGVPNKATAEIKELAQQHTAYCIQALQEIAHDDEHPARVAAIKELLDRGHGRPSQAIENKHEGKIEIVVIREEALPVADGSDDDED